LEQDGVNYLNRMATSGTTLGTKEKIMEEPIKQDQQKEGQQEVSHEVECPKCKHHFFHKIGDALKGAVESAGNAIGDAAFGGNR
jgi:hypothetical protein